MDEKMCAEDKINISRLRLCKLLGYMGPETLRLRLREVPTIGTIAVNWKGDLLFNRDFVENIFDPTDDQMGAGFIAHEILHIMLDHNTRGKQCGLDRETANIAGDLEINCILKKANLLPCNALLPEMFGFNPDLTFEAYAELLKNEKESNEIESNDDESDNKESVDNKSEEKSENQSESENEKQEEIFNDEEKTKTNNGETSKHHQPCGSCCGNPVEGEPEPEGELPEILKTMKQKQFASDLKSYEMTNPGSVPGVLTDWAKSVLKPKPIPWQHTLSALVRRCAGHRPGNGKLVNTFFSPVYSGLYAKLGEQAPIILGKSKPNPTLKFILDISGSMQSHKDTLSLAAGVLIDALETLSADIQLYLADTEIKSVHFPKSPEDIVSFIKSGGGGTNMRNAYLEVTENQTDYAAVFVITDGYTDWPERNEIKYNAPLFPILVGREDKCKDVPDYLQTIFVKKEDR